MDKNEKLTGDSLSGLFMRALVSIAKVELKLVVSFVLGLVFSAVFLLCVPVVGLNWNLKAYVDECAPSIDQALDVWKEKQQRNGLNVKIEQVPVERSNTSWTTTSVSYRVSYTNLSPFDFYSVMVAADSDHPFPESTHKLCRPIAFDFGIPSVSNLELLLSVWMVGWYLAILVLVGLSTALQGRCKPQRLSIDRATVVFVLRYAFIGIVTASLVVAIELLAQSAGFGLENAQASALIASTRKASWLLVLVVFVGPVCEELLFRGWLLRDFIAAGLPRFGTIVVSLSFASSHIFGVEPSVGLALYGAVVFLLSVVFCHVYIKSKSVWASALTHMAHNAITMAFAFYG